MTGASYSALPRAVVVLATMAKLTAAVVVVVVVVVVVECVVPDLFLTSPVVHQEEVRATPTTSVPPRGCSALHRTKE